MNSKIIHVLDTILTTTALFPEKISKSFYTMSLSTGMAKERLSRKKSLLTPALLKSRNSKLKERILNLQHLLSHQARADLTVHQMKACMELNTVGIFTTVT